MNLLFNIFIIKINLYFLFNYFYLNIIYKTLFTKNLTNKKLKKMYSEGFEPSPLRNTALRCRIRPLS